MFSDGSNSPRAVYSDEEREREAVEGFTGYEELETPQYQPFDPSFFSGLSSPPPSQTSFDEPSAKAHAPPPISEASQRSNLALTLNNELRTLQASNKKFEAFPPHRIFETANVLVANGILSLEAFRTTDETARRYLFEDLRKTEKMSFLQLAFLFKLARHIPPHDQKVSEKNMRFTELDIPKALEKYAPPLSALSAFFLPDQDQVNFVRKEIAIAASKDPPYVPYLIPKLTEAPWLPSDSEHSSARKWWVANSKQAKRSLSPQEMTIQAFALYHLRFLFAADLCQAFSIFGGLGPQLSHFSTVLHLGVTESVGTALAYHRLVGLKLQEKARKRTVSPSDFIALLASESLTLKEQAKKEIAAAIMSDVKEREVKRKDKGKGKKNDSSSSNYRGKNDKTDEASQENPPKKEQDFYYRKEGDNRRQDRSRSRNRDRGNKYGPNNRKNGKGRQRE